MGLSQGQLAAMAGLSKQTMSETERGNSMPNRATLIRICDSLKLSLNERASIYAFYRMPKETGFDRVSIDIRTRREGMGLTQKGLADAIGVSRADISRLEAGNIKFASIASLAYDFFGIPDDERVKNEDNQHQEMEYFGDTLPESK